jgi:hypothetical protein
MPKLMSKGTLIKDDIIPTANPAIKPEIIPIFRELFN